MKQIFLLLYVTVILTAAPMAAELRSSSEIRAVIGHHLGRPYVWGASGLKSFDCSGFVWRVMFENGMFIKRTTARKYYMSLPRISQKDRWSFGIIVFFNNLKHCGIVNDSGSFYHAQTSKGTDVSKFDRFWRSRITGFRLGLQHSP